MSKMPRALLFCTLCLCLAVLAGCSVLEKDSVTNRVESVFDGLKTSGNTQALQISICQWARGINHIPDQKELASAWDEQTAWLAAKGLKQPISDYAILSVELEKDPSRPGAFVQVRVDGKELWLWVEKGEPIAWAEE